MSMPPLPPLGGEPPRPYGVDRFPTSQHGDYYGQRPQPPESKTMAGWALGLSIFNCFSVGIFVAIGLAIAVLVKSQRDGRDHGKGMAIAALIISALWIIGFFVLIVLIVIGKIEIDDSERDRSGEITQEQDIAWTSLRVGDCLADAELDAEDYDVTATPCGEPHGLEAYAEFELPDGSFPGDDEVVRLADVGCFDRFREFVGIAPIRSELYVSYTYPSSLGWRISDERGVLCLIGEADGGTVGTLEDSRR
jgi:hypothetical protein